MCSWNFFFFLVFFSFCLPKSLSKRVLFSFSLILDLFLFWYFIYSSFAFWKYKVLASAQQFNLFKLAINPLRSHVSPNGNQTHFSNSEWNWFVIRRVREHSDLKWQLNIPKRKSIQRKERDKKWNSTRLRKHLNKWS